MCGVIANILLLVVILKDKKLRQKPTNHFIVAISIAELLVAVLPCSLFLVTIPRPPKSQNHSKSSNFKIFSVQEIIGAKYFASRVRCCL